MKKILLIFTNLRDNIDIVDEVLNREGREIFLKVVFLATDVIPRNFSTWLMYMGFLGEEPTKEIRDVIIKEIEKNLIEKKAELEDKLKQENIRFEILFIKGDVEKINHIIKGEKFDMVYTSRPKDSLFGEEKIDIAKEI